MPPLIPFPETALPQLKNAPIELIVGQVRFPLVPALLDANGIAPFHSLAKTQYPHIQQESQVAIRFSNEDAPRGERLGSLWKFESADHGWTLAVAPNFVALEARQYRSFAEFRDRLLTATSWFATAYESTLRTRIGLRYVDRINSAKYPYLQPGWMNKINAPLLALSALAPAQEHRTFIEHRLSLGSQYGLVLRATIERAEHPDGNEFVFDLDAFCEEESGFAQLVDSFDTLKAINYRAFAWTANGLIADLEQA